MLLRAPRFLRTQEGQQFLKGAACASWCSQARRSMTLQGSTCGCPAGLSCLCPIPALPWVREEACPPRALRGIHANTAHLEFPQVHGSSWGVWPPTERVMCLPYLSLGHLLPSLMNVLLDAHYVTNTTLPHLTPIPFKM